MLPDDKPLFPEMGAINYSLARKLQKTARGRYVRPLAMKLDGETQGWSSAVVATTRTSPCRFTRKKVIPQGGLVILIKRVA